MPEPDGSALAAEPRNDPGLGGVPVLFLTAPVSREDVRPESLGMGRRVYPPKPLEWRRLLAWIEACEPAAPAARYGRPTRYGPRLSTPSGAGR
jgi:DNA-binding response OmpR family regulator